MGAPAPKHANAPPKFIDLKVDVILPPADVGPALHESLKRIMEVARGTHDDTTLPAARSHDHKAFRAASLHEHSAMWEHVILPNSSLSEDGKASVLNQIKHGINAAEYEVPRDKCPTQLPAYWIQPNRPTTGTMHDGTTLQAEFITAQLAEYERVGAIRRVDHDFPTDVSPIFVDTSRPKGRLVTDMRHKNTRARPPKFRLHTLNEFKRAILPGALLIKTDLCSGFLHLGIDEASQPGYGIRWGGVSYVFTAANFGASPTPFIFQRLTTSVAALLTRMGINSCVYLDDMIFCCLPATTTRTAAQRAADTVWLVKEVMFLCGLYIHPDKSMLSPSTVIEALGFQIDTVHQTFLVLQSRRDSIVALAHDLLHTKSGTVTVLDMQRFCGKAVSLALAAPAIKMYLGPLWSSLSSASRGHVILTPLLKVALAEFSTRNVDKWGGLAKWRPETHTAIHAVRIFTDAAGGDAASDLTSHNGWGVALYLPHSTVPVTYQGRI
jgi:hypothetical protein